MSLQRFEDHNAIHVQATAMPTHPLIQHIHTSGEWEQKGDKISICGGGE